MSLLDLSRWQFVITVMFHMTFPAITVGLSILLSVLYGMYWKTRRAVYLQMFRFWRRVFAVGFAIGVVAGIVITFEMGLNWGDYAVKTGPIIGPIIGMEVVTAFFVEAGFIGVLLYGDGRVRHATMFVSSVMVSIGTVLSSTWIIAANSWMQTPAGFVVRNGRFEPTDWVDAIFNRSFVWRWPHMVLAVLISAAFFVAGIGAYYLVKGRALPFARRSVSIALGVGCSARRGCARPAGCLGSAINRDLTCKTAIPGLDLTPRADRPDMAAVFWGFRVMFLAALLMFGTVFYATILRFRRKLWTSERFHRFLLWTTPVGILAILGGWATAETGRQPWVVFGQLRTADAVSHLAPGELVFSVVGFSLLYVVMLVAYIAYIVHSVRIGPDQVAPRRTAPGPRLSTTASLAGGRVN